MNYLVLETHPAYVVVLDEQGRFLKAANQNYQVGQQLGQIIPFRQPKPEISWVKKSMASLAGLAACLCLVLGGYFGYYQPNFTAYGSLLVEINPQVELTLSQTHRVLDLGAQNEDGQVLIEDYDYQNKDGDTVVEELVARAMELGFLSNGESVTLTVQGQDTDWNRQQEDSARSALESRYGDAITIYLSGEQPEQEVILPLPTPSQTTSSSPAPVAVEDDDGDDGEDDVEDGGDDDDDDGGDDGHQPSAPQVVTPPAAPVQSTPAPSVSQPVHVGDEDDDDNDDGDDDDGDDGDDDDGDDGDDDDGDDGDDDDDGGSDDDDDDDDGDD